MREPAGFLLENLDMGRNIDWASRQTAVKRLINLGSSCMYPRNQNEPLSEELVLKGELEPANEGYALAKVVTARLREFIIGKDASFHYKTLIPCDLYGRHDKFDPAHSHLIPTIIHKVHQAILSGVDQVEIWGAGTALRKFMYVGDLADVLVRAIKEFDDEPMMINVGLGHDHFFNEYNQATADVLGYRGEFVHDWTNP